MSKNFELLRQADWKQDLFESAQTETPPLRKINPPMTPNHPPAPSPHYRSIGRVPNTDQISALVHRVFLDPRKPDVRSVTFSCVAPRAGCTWTCAQTARTLADLVDGTVCAVDVNFSDPSIHGHFGIENLVGLSDAVFQGKPARTFVRQFGGSNLHILAGGGECARARSEGATIARVLRDLRHEFDYVLVDAPPLLNGSLAARVAQSGDGAILVLESTGIALESLLRAKERLRAAGVPLFGVVMNHRRSAPTHSLFGQFSR